MSRVMTIRRRDGPNVRPIFEQMGEGLWRATIVKDGTIIGEGTTKTEAALRLQWELDQVYRLLASYAKATEPD